VRFGGFEIQAVVEVHTNPQPRLVDLEESTEPGAEEGDHRGIRVLAKSTLPSFFDPSPA
jgi:hypothetical protein